MGNSTITRVINGPGVHIDPEAVAQLERVANRPGCVCAVGMPDLHPGRGIPVGVATSFHRRVYPELVGSDAGCGVTLAVARKVASPTRRQRRIERLHVGPFDADPVAMLEAAWRGGPAELATLGELPEAFRVWVGQRPPGKLGPVVPLPEALREPSFGESLGTIGGGNHFLELARVESLIEPGALDGLDSNAFVVLAHSGSRSLGHAVARRWHGRCLEDPVDVRQYLGELAGCVRFAQANRAVLVWNMLDAVGSGRVDRIGGCLDLVHNTVVAGENPGDWVHRKGAAPADVDALTVTLGSRGSPSWLLRGTGSAEHLSSVAHGAGRRIPRSEAKARLSRRYRRTELARTPGGGHVLCDEPDLLWEEHPDAYKAIEPVIAAIESAGIASRVASMGPVVTVKR